ncbi:hypothetical protein GTV32_02750 [Gordonia sp. SID5947]|uniref:hypothetical protein n=1 Tax=Gordonia sp. SID5947 TaxID=2690315 RepID=UPI00136A6E5A|nr:hypothetical protein [Gordonia sp. SID5947]MYR05304.1 hypothetical protein [Gordonia sp. SID5947]
MALDATITANQTFDAWTDAGVKLSKELDKLRAGLDALKYVDTRPPGLADVEITEKNAEHVVRERAAQLVPSIDIGNQSAMSRAKREIQQNYAVRALRGLAATVDDAVDQLTPAFDDAAARYVDAVNRLPVGVTNDDIVRIGDPDVLAALNDAKRAAAELAGYQAFIVSLSDLPGVGGLAPVHLRITAPSAAKQFWKLADGRLAAGRGMSEVEKSLNPVWLTAAREGIGFRMLTPKAAGDLVDELEASRVRGYAGTGTEAPGMPITLR